MKFKNKTDADNWYAVNGGIGEDSSGKPAGKVVVKDIGKIGIRHARNNPAVDGTIKKFTWPEGQNVRQLNPVLGNASGVADGFECIAVVVNVPSADANLAAIMLAEVTSETEDDQSLLFYPGSSNDSILNNKAITNVFYQRRSGTAVMRFQLGAK